MDASGPTETDMVIKIQRGMVIQSKILNLNN